MKDSRRILDSFSVILAAAVMGLVAHYFVGNAVLLFIAYVPIVCYVEGSSRSPSFVAWVLAKRTLVGCLAAFALALTMLGIAFLPSSTTTPESTPSEAVHLQAVFLVIGGIVGILLRRACGKLAMAVLFAKKRMALNILALVIWTVGLILYPWNEHVGARLPYIGCVAVGIALQWGSGIARKAAAYRRIRHIADAFLPGESWNKAECVAVHLFTRGRFRKLRKKLGELRAAGHFTKRLALISAALYRHDGKYRESLVVAREFANGPGNPDVHLLLLKAVNHKELGEDKEAQACLGQLFQFQDIRCPLAYSTRALWRAELELADHERLPNSKEAVEDAHRALVLGRVLMLERMNKTPDDQDNIDSLLRRFVAFGMPVTATTIQDVLAYCHLAAGYPEEAILMLGACIGADPYYSSAYLHLGDYFLRRGGLSGETDEHSDLWHAEACYCLARSLERNEDSRVRRLAEQKLADICKGVVPPGWTSTLRQQYLSWVADEETAGIEIPVPAPQDGKTC